jgi:4-hydroxy-2-oxoglutarate aldolase
MTKATARLRGVLVPVTTPFDPVTGDLAPVPLRENARACLADGAEGIVAAGSTGEASLLDETEFRQLVEWLRDVVPPERVFVVGAGRESTRAAVAACRVAGEFGADAVLVRAPAYYGPSLPPAALTEHFRRIADASPVPVLLYNIPKYTHLAIADRQLAALADHENVVGVKDSSGDLKNFAAYVHATPRWAHFMGSGVHLYAALELGAVGGILAVANPATALTCSIWEAWAAGDRAVAGGAQERLTPINKLVVGELGVPGIKAALDVVGRVGGPVRPPLADVGPADRKRIAEALHAGGVPVAD